jgi:hypothetical protein
LTIDLSETLPIISTILAWLLLIILISFIIFSIYILQTRLSFQNRYWFRKKYGYLTDFIPPRQNQDQSCR